MTVYDYVQLHLQLGSLVSESVPHAFDLRRGIPASLPHALNAVYIVESLGGRVAYVGSTRVTTAKRLRQHMRRWKRATRWVRVWVLPVAEHVPEHELRRAEGIVGRSLHPRDNRRLPAV
ncbi:hypothetical protein GCM10010840_23900 [Deinococcus aerolatus]|uniref:GIY-YIG domain-containing protein n=1 Tax=Deinococcus aerolatus TaxID=522487 RepID=A0ABQ2GCC7_9DEIO|nr:hypothetical protein GCM10010840_23900 [Deinococcus aerolatus]